MRCALALVGGGLANALLALRLAEERPDADLLLIERGATLGGNHTWSFHGTDLEADSHHWLEPLVVHAWTGHEVRFPARRRELRGSYHSITSERLHAVLSERLGRRVLLGADVSEVSAGHVVLADGTLVEAGAVVDGRGDPTSTSLVLRYQKFLGRHVRMAEPHGLERPVLMDATVPQEDGYRFVYVLPFDERRALIEDTYYSDGPELQIGVLAERIERYCEAQGWRVEAVEGDERGVLPIALSGNIERLWSEGPPGVARTGLRAALFHPTTGYSVPEAVGMAEAVAAAPDLAAGTLWRLTRERSLAAWRRYRFFRMLNRMMFLAGRPRERYRVLERFYGLPEPLIERFYAGRLRPGDYLRLVSGKPPVPLGRAVRAVLASGRSGPRTGERAA